MAIKQEHRRTVRAKRTGHARETRDGTPAAAKQGNGAAGAAPVLLKNEEPTPLNHPDPTRPHTYPRRVLLAVTGLSPQIVTETLYALSVRPRRLEDKFIPTEVRLVTTVTGEREARLNLLTPKTGWFHRLRTDYQLPRITFRDIEILREKDKLLDDIRTAEENERAADFITDIVRTLTQDESCALHVSIAGGRKTMGYYLGYALSLYGRPQDRLSHVLISEPFENNREFFYPTPYVHRIHVNRSGKDATYDARDAEIDLAPIPFVRLRDGLSEDLLSGRASFSETVHEAQKSIPPIELRLIPDTRTVIAGGERFTLKPTEFAFYWMFAERARQECPGLHWSEDLLVDELLGYLSQIINPASGDYEKTEKAYRCRYTKDNFDPTKSHINKAIIDALGKRWASPYQITKQDKIPGTRYTRSGLNLPTAAITIERTSF